VTAPDEQPTLEYDEVGPGYLATMGIPLVSGREFNRDDNETALPVAVVNEAMAAKYLARRRPNREATAGEWKRGLDRNYGKGRGKGSTCY